MLSLQTKKILAFLLLLCSFAQAETRFVNISSSIARPLGMGGAFGAVQDGVAAIFYNPASFTTFKSDNEDYEKQAFTFIANPIAPIIVTKDYKKFGSDTDFKVGDGIRTLTYFVKSLIFSTRRIKGGFIFNEESFYAKEKFGNDSFLNSEHFDFATSTTAFVNFSIAQKVKLGVSASQYSIRNEKGAEKVDGLSFSYGVFLKPNKRYNFGITFHSLSDSVKVLEERVKRLADNSLNISYAYIFIKNLNLAAELKNLTAETGAAARELHLGIEYDLFENLTLRTGFYKELNSSTSFQTWTFGLGILDQNLWKSHWESYQERNYLINYALVFEKNKSVKNFWHVLGIYYRI
ncbi:MAG: hypothetical protein DWQ06_05835 [Calditrichaeota bacterium]|nr:MAG: hypothetical protein DWQ06_05835 [Calditrichota bacterium]